MKSIPIPSDLFVQNRQRLTARMRPASLAVLHSNDIMPTNADGTMGFHQNADLFYLTGVNQEESILLLAPGAFDEKQREILFVREPSEHLKIWEGHKLSKAQATEISGVAQVRWISEFPGIFRQLMVECDEVYLNSNEYPKGVGEVESRDRRFIRECQAQYPLHHYNRLARLLSDLRLVKSSCEVDMIQKACAITRKGFLRVLSFVRPGVNEAEVEAEFAHEFVRSKGQFAYPPIICSGENNCVLHYNQNDQECRDGELLLMDVAAGYGQYMSDLTRTIPVNGKFTPRQRTIYDAVLRVFRQVVAAMKPGAVLKDLRSLTEKLTEQELLSIGLLKQDEVAKQDPDKPLVQKYFMHGVAHPIGLDVHDVGLRSRTVQPGWVLTCEPAIYIAEEKFGIRLENDILITEDGPVDLMSDIPIEADEIESLMRSR
jgi:Xaa-Pro aminopeptidase